MGLRLNRFYTNREWYFLVNVSELLYGLFIFRLFISHIKFCLSYTVVFDLLFVINYQIVFNL